MNKIFESPNCIVEYDGNSTVYKTLKTKKIPPEWLPDYNRLRNNDPRYVEVFEVLDDYTFTMEYINELDTLEHILRYPKNWHYINRQILIEAVETFHTAFTDGLRVSKQEPNRDSFFLHTDLKVSNLIVDKNMNIQVIDPDSYAWIKQWQWTEKYYMNQINMAFLLQRYFYQNV